MGKYVRTKIIAAMPNIKIKNKIFLLNESISCSVNLIKKDVRLAYE